MVVDGHRAVEEELERVEHRVLVGCGVTTCFEPPRPDLGPTSWTWSAYSRGFEALAFESGEDTMEFAPVRTTNRMKTMMMMTKIMPTTRNDDDGDKMTMMMTKTMLTTRIGPPRPDLGPTSRTQSAYSRGFEALAFFVLNTEKTMIVGESERGLS